MSEPWPEELRLHRGGQELEVAFDSKERFSLPAEYLRVESPSAEVKGHGPGQEVTLSGKRGVRIVRLDPVGNYAVKIVFDDGHNTGLYPWSLLYRLGRDQKKIWSDYLTRLKAKGLSRD